MIIKQLSIFVENKSGRLAQITQTIASLGINIRALSIADTTDFGILRIIVDDADEAAEKLRRNSMTVSVCRVLSVGISDTPGGLSKVLTVLADGGVAVEYVYAFGSPVNDGKALVVIRADKTDEAEKCLKNAGYGD